ncbi:sulfotransferase [Nocardioides mangrovi]|uniref:Sulfotransferase n=1 Tax=Nocardioides mangrovi TaxID=2874580 RepID=A0ABS7U9F8_9ACTN|nr:sulfotransferase [Nocardioides mangrovi]MBZ5737292.1 sulfotransferase [Nocardioides mangrovi]
MSRTSRLRARFARRPKTYRYVFVVTYGRSGSTLVQGLLNTLPRTLVRGENGFYLLPLFRARATAQAFRKIHLKHNPKASHSAFYGLNDVTPRSFVESTRELVTGHLLGSVSSDQVDVLGFKEVLWHRIRPGETEAFFDFMDRTFPGCLYVLNERDQEAVVGSGFWQSHDRDEVLGAIRRVEEIQAELRRTRPDRVIDLRYELVTSDDQAVSDEQLRRLATFVHGSCDDALLAALRETRTTGHGPYPFGKSRGRREGT